MSDQQYEISRNCAICGQRDVVFVTKIEAAFDLKHAEIQNQACSRCGATKSNGMSREIPPLDKELLDIWAQHDDYYFLEQDEDLLLADNENLDLILEAIDQNVYSKGHMALLVDILLLIIYQNITPDGALGKAAKMQREFYEQALVKAIKRKEVIQQFNHSPENYVAAAVYPRLGIKFDLS